MPIWEESRHTIILQSDDRRDRSLKLDRAFHTTAKRLFKRGARMRRRASSLPSRTTDNGTARRRAAGARLRSQWRPQ
jgi:hypothetical protein